MKLDEYNRKARLYPSVIVLIPCLLFTINCNIENLSNVFDSLLKVKIIGNVTIAIVLLFLLMQINRFLGKFMFEKNIFKDEMAMPTTNYLLFGNSQFTKEYKLRLHQHILADFQIQLSNEVDEAQDEKNARRRIVEAVGLIRQKVKSGRLLLQFNIEYGFARNLIGGSIIGLMVSIFDIVYFFMIGNQLIGGISIFLAVIFSILLGIHKVVIKHLGNQYAKRLFQEYLQP